jgi:hypothetical protein
VDSITPLALLSLQATLIKVALFVLDAWLLHDITHNQAEKRLCLIDGACSNALLLLKRAK